MLTLGSILKTTHHPCYNEHVAFIVQDCGDEMLRFLTWRNTAVGDVEVLVGAKTRIREDEVRGLNRACRSSFTS